jgi:hypothetical protein
MVYPGQPGAARIYLTFDPVNPGNLKMAEDQKEPIAAPKKKIVRCDKVCTYVSSGNEPRRCKARCAQEAGHILSCKCRTHEMQ